MRRVGIALVGLLCLCWAPAMAQSREETLADIRQELSVVHVELQRLKRELSTTGAPSRVTVDGTVIERVAAIESEVQRLTGKIEELEFRIERVARDGGNRLSDLEFRLCELESGCDVSRLGQGTTLGGAAAESFVAPAASVVAGPDSESISAQDATELAVGEKADFDAATKAFEKGEYALAADRFAAFLRDYPGSPLAADAGLKRGEALEQAGTMTTAARAYLDTFSADPDGPRAPEALFRLGRALGRLGQMEEACVTLGEVGLRFPGDAAAEKARAEMQDLGCR